MAALPPPMTTTLRPRLTASPFGHRLQQRQRRIDTLQFGARQVHPRLFPCADGEEYGVEALIQFVERNVGADAGVEGERHPQTLDQLDLAPQYRFGQAILGQAQNAACLPPRAAGRIP